MADVVHELQAAVEGVPTDGTIEYGGTRYRVAEKVAAMALAKLAKIGQQGTDANNMAGLAAMHDALRAVIHRDDWNRFEQATLDNYADGDMLMELFNAALEAIAARPTQRSTDSSAGPSPTSVSSKDTSSSKADGEMAELVSIQDLLQARSTG